MVAQDESPPSLDDCYIGVKPYERALLQLVECDSVCKPTRTVHPLLPHGAEDNIMPWPAIRWDEMHAKLHPAGAGVPQSRAGRKCWQLESLCALAQLCAEDRFGKGKPCHLVDFAGGCGPLGLPLAAVLPQAIVTIVELKPRSLAIARERAAEAGLTNVRFYEGDIRAFDEPFDVGLALHACGVASDLVIEACVQANARFVVCPCCTGKISTDRKDVYRFAVTGSNEQRVEYPRSEAVRSALSPEAYNFLACAADVSDAAMLAGDRGLLRRLCKAYLEHDRRLWAVERGYEVHVTAMHRLEASPKRDILYGWAQDDRPQTLATLKLLTRAIEDEAVASAQRLGFGSSSGNGAGENGGVRCEGCVEEEEAREPGATNATAAAAAAAGADRSAGGESHGEEAATVSSSSSSTTTTSAGKLGGALGASEWTADELEQAFERLRGLAAGEETTVLASSARKRRLVHYAAAALGMHHETLKGVGKGAVRVQRLASS